MRTIDRFVPALLLALALPLPAAAAAQARCHCPCSVSCGKGVTSQCPQHSEDCKYAHCISSRGDFIGDLIPGLTVGQLGKSLPQGYVDHAPWFGLELPETILAGVGGVDRDSGTETHYVFTMRLQDPLAGTYAVEEPADLAAWQEWLASIDPDGPFGVSIGAITDPAEWKILDGDLRHLNESIAWRFHLVLGQQDVVFMRKDSTPAWEAWTYLHSAVGQLPDDAFRPGIDPAAARAELHGMLDTFHVLVSGSFFARARREVEGMRARCEEWLVPGHRMTAATVGALRKVEALLAGGSR